MAKILVLGAVNMDIGAVSSAPLVGQDSNPGTVRTALGGVGCNIARNLCLLGQETAMVTVLGEDTFAREVRSAAAELGLDLTECETVPGGRTGTYVFLAGPDGDMALAVNDMEIYQNITPAFLSRHLDALNSASLVVLDANLPRESIEYLCAHCTAPILADPVSTIKAERLIGVLGRLYAIKPNRLEAERLTGLAIRTPEDAERAAESLLRQGVRRVYISLSEQGLLAAEAGRMLRVPCPRVAAVNTTGAGDSMTAAIALGEAAGKPLEEIARFAVAAGALTATAMETVHPGMSYKRITDLMNEYSIGGEAL